MSSARRTGSSILGPKGEMKGAESWRKERRRRWRLSAVRTPDSSCGACSPPEGIEPEPEVMQRAVLVLLLLGCGALLSGVQTAPPPPAETKPPRAKTAGRPPLDFSGTWELDPKMSSGATWRM